MSEIASQPVAQEDCTFRNLRHSLMAAGAALVLVHASPAYADNAGDQSSNGGVEAPVAGQVVTPHEFALGSQDDSAIASKNVYEIIKSYAKAKKMGATWERIIIHPTVLGNPNKWRPYDTAVNVAHHLGLNMEVTVSLEGVQWTDTKIKRYFGQVLRRYATKQDAQGPYVKAVGAGNEVNRPTMLNPYKGMNAAETYRHIYQLVQPMIANAPTHPEVFFGELSSSDDPVGFMKQVSAAPAGEKDKPLTMAKYAYHGYQLDNSANDQIPDEPGIGTLSVVEDEIESEYHEAKIQTPDEQLPPLALTEIGWFLKDTQASLNAPADLQNRYLPDWQRRKNYWMSLNIACNDPRVSLMMFYGMLPPQPNWEGYWNTSLVTSGGKTTGTFKMIQRYSKSHPECIKHKPID